MRYTLAIGTLVLALAITAGAGALAAEAACKPQEHPPITSATGNWAILPQFDEAGRGPGGFLRDRAAVKIDGKWGVIDLNGRMLIRPQFDTLQYGDVSGPTLIVKVGGERGKWGVVDRVGNFLIQPKYLDLIRRNDGLYSAEVESSAADAYYSGFYNTKIKRILVDATGVESEFHSDAADPDGLKFVYGKYNEDTKKFGLAHFPDDKWLTPAIFDKIDGYLDPCSGLVGARIGDDATGRWGFINASGKFKINPRFGAVRYFSDGLGPVNFGDSKSPRWGFIDQAGRTIIKPQFEEAQSFSAGLAAVRQGGKVGFIDAAGNLVIPPRFENEIGRLPYFLEGRAAVLLNGKWGFIRR